LAATFRPSSPGCRPPTRRARSSPDSSRPSGMAPPRVPRVDWRVVDRQARRLLTDWRELLTRRSSEARPVLCELLEAPLGSRRSSRRAAAAIGSRARFRSEGC
jgi:hypothetical protein